MSPISSLSIPDSENGLVGMTTTDATGQYQLKEKEQWIQGREVWDVYNNCLEE